MASNRNNSKLAFWCIAISFIPSMYVACSPQFTTVNVKATGISTNNSSNSPNSTTQTFSNQYSSAALKILADQCSSCHGTSTGSAGVYGLNDVKHMIATGLVVAGKPDQSLIYNSIKTRSMPPSGSFSAADQETIRQWIAAGNTGSQPASPAPALPSPLPVPPPSTPPPPNPTFTKIKTTILEPKCQSCHSGYITYEVVSQLVDKNNPTMSKIYVRTLDGTMPKGGVKLTATEQGDLLKWIQAGAKND